MLTWRGMEGFVQAMRAALTLLGTLVATAAYAAPPAPQYNVKTDAILFTGGTSLGDSNRVRWDIYLADSSGGKSSQNLGGAYDATYEAKLPPGKYIGVAALGSIRREVPFEVKDGVIAKPFANFEAAQLKIIPKRTADGKPAGAEARLTVSQGDFEERAFGAKDIYVPAGDVTLKGSIGPAQAETKLTLKPGEIKDYVLVIPSGVVVTTAVYKQDGLTVTGDDIRFDAMAIEKSLEGVQNRINGTYGIGKVLDMPAGDFLMRAQMGKVTTEVPFTVKAGERTDLVIDLNAGVLAITAPGAERIDIDVVSNDIQAKRKMISGGYASQYQDTLTPGDYVVKVTYDKSANKDPKEVKATVKAAERTELKVE